MNVIVKTALIALVVVIVMKALDRLFLDGVWDKFLPAHFEAED